MSSRASSASTFSSARVHRKPAAAHGRPVRSFRAVRAVARGRVDLRAVRRAAGFSLCVTRRGGHAQAARGGKPRPTRWGRYPAILLAFAALLGARDSSAPRAFRTAHPRQSMFGMNGFALPDYWLAKWGSLGEWLAMNGVAFSDARGLVRGGLVNWIVILLAIVWFAPNTQQIMARFSPALLMPLDIRPARWLAWSADAALALGGGARIRATSPSPVFRVPVLPVLNVQSKHMPLFLYLACSGRPVPAPWRRPGVEPPSAALARGARSPNCHAAAGEARRHLPAPITQGPRQEPWLNDRLPHSTRSCFGASSGWHPVAAFPPVDRLHFSPNGFPHHPL